MLCGASSSLEVIILGREREKLTDAMYKSDQSFAFQLTRTWPHTRVKLIS